MATGQQRRERAAKGSRRKRDLDAASGFRRSKRPGDAGIVDNAISAAYHATPEQKQRAGAAALQLKVPFAYNACLLLMAEGKDATPDVVRAEAKRLHAASDRFVSGSEKTEEAA